MQTLATTHTQSSTPDLSPEAMSERVERFEASAPMAKALSRYDDQMLRAADLRDEFEAALLEISFRADCPAAIRKIADAALAHRNAQTDDDTAR